MHILSRALTALLIIITAIAGATPHHPSVSTNISSPLANFGSPPVGAAVNMHQTQISTPGTVLAKFGAMRLDDIGTGGSISTLTGMWTYSKNAQFNNIQDADFVAWGANVAGHVRDMVLSGSPDWVSEGNEPDLNSISHSTCFTRAKQIYYATRGCHVRLIGLNLSSWTSTAQTFVDNSISDGTLDYLDAVGIHVYPVSYSDAPEVAATQIAALRAKLNAAGYTNMPIIVTEIGCTTAYVTTQKGSWTAAGAADLYNRFVTACLGAGASGVVIYDGPLSTNLDGFAPRTAVTVGTTGATITVGSTTGMSDGQVIYFSNAAIFATIATNGVKSSTSVLVTASITVTTADSVYFTDNNECLTDNTNARPLLTALNGLLPVGGVGNAIVFRDFALRERFEWR